MKRFLSSSAYAPAIAVGAIFLLATAMKIHVAVVTSFWSDELSSLFYAGHEDWSALFWDNTPPLFYLFLKDWRQLVSAEAALRALPVLFSCATPLVLAISAREFFDRRTALWVVAIASLQATSFARSTELRSYSLFELTSAVNLFFFVKAYRERRLSIGYALSSFFTLASHYMALVLLGCQLAIIARRTGDTGLKRFGSILLVILVVTLTFVHFDSLRFLALDSPWQPFGFPFEVFRVLNNESLTTVAAMTVALFAMLGQVDGLDDVVIVVAISTVPIGLTTWLNPVSSRYFIFLTPYLSLILAAFAARGARPRLVRAVVGAFLLLNVWSIAHGFGQEHGGWKTAAAAVPVDQPVVVLGHSSLRTLYLEKHKFFAIANERELPRLRENLAGARTVWMLYVHDMPSMTSANLEREIEATGLTAERRGVFAPNAAQPVYFVAFARPPEKAKADDDR